MSAAVSTGPTADTSMREDVHSGPRSIRRRRPLARPLLMSVALENGFDHRPAVWAANNPHRAVVEQLHYEREKQRAVNEKLVSTLNRTHINEKRALAAEAKVAWPVCSARLSFLSDSHPTASLPPRPSCLLVHR